MSKLKLKPDLPDTKVQALNCDTIECSFIYDVSSMNVGF
jgi:hypothetical protein